MEALSVAACSVIRTAIECLGEVYRVAKEVVVDDLESVAHSVEAAEHHLLRRLLVQVQ